MPTQQPVKIHYKRPPLYPKQEDALFCPERFGVVLASTKSGKTVGCIAWLLEQAWMGKPNRHYWWVAPIYRQAKIAYDRIRTGLTPGTFTTNKTELSITLINGAIIEFKGADDPDTLYGEDVYAAVFDEFTRATEESYHAIRSTLTQTGGPMRFIGNVKGRGNWGYRLAMLAESGRKDWHYAKITAYDAAEAGIFPTEEIEDAKASLPENVFRELYLAEPSDDGGNPFGIDNIAMQVGPLSRQDPVVFGIDLAKSQDWTVVLGLDHAGDVCRFERWQSPWQDTIRRVIATVGDVPALVDSTGVGDPILEQLQAEKPGVYTGFKFNPASKQQLMEGLAVAIQQRDIRYPEGVIVNELNTFEYTYTRTGGTRYEAAGGAHDDTVCALALAVHHWGPHRRDLLPFGWLRSNIDFRRAVLGHE